MEQENKHNVEDQKKKDYLLPASIFFSAVIVALALIYKAGAGVTQTTQPEKESGAISSQLSVTELPLKWGDLGAQMVKAGVIDRAQFEAIYAGRGGLTENDKSLLLGVNNGNLNITKENAGVILNLLWALGLSNKNQVLEKGPMMDPRYGGAGRFASTGGWVIAKGNPLDHYSAHVFMNLTPEQQTLVEKVSKSIYRPCCDNSTYFPDCNHGMAMLGLLELLASQGASEEQMYRAALVMNSYWFPDQYATIARYLASKGIDPQSADPKELLGIDYSSASGYQRIATLAPKEPNQKSGGGACGV